LLRGCMYLVALFVLYPVVCSASASIFLLEFHRDSCLCCLFSSEGGYSAKRRQWSVTIINQATGIIVWRGQ